MDLYDETLLLGQSTPVKACKTEVCLFRSQGFYRFYLAQVSRRHECTQLRCARSSRRNGDDARASQRKLQNCECVVWGFA